MSDNVRGYVKPGFEHVRDVFAQNFEKGEELGAGFAAIQDGEVLVDLQGGFADRAKKQIWDERTLVPIYSTTKAISAFVVAYVLSQSDRYSHESKMTEFWPEFGAAGKEALSIGDVLSHQGGLPGFKDEFNPSLWLDPVGLSAKLAETEPLWSPVPDGTSGYHPLTWGYLAGEIVRRIAGKSLGTVLAEVITGTAGDAPDIDFWIGTPESEHDRCADIQRPKELPELGPINDFKKAAFMTKWASPNRGGPEWRKTEIPSANGHGTAKSVAQLYAGFAQGGRIGETQFLDEESWEGLTRQRTFGPDRVLPFEIEFAAGVMRNSSEFYGPNHNSFGHSGWGGSAALGDPDLKLSAAYVMNRQSNKLQADPRGQRLFAALYDCI